MNKLKNIYTDEHIARDKKYFAEQFEKDLNEILF